MLIMDIKSIPLGMDIETWGIILREHKLCIYDSDKESLPPIYISDNREEGKDVVFIDTHNMSNRDLDLLRKAYNLMTENEKIQSSEAREKMRERQKKLIDYLKNLNDETEKDTDSKKDDHNNKEGD